ncbi:MAG TPA: hypothetical protein VGR62_21900 [Candidatus Binatia bacterium]|jgi:predicted dienelactone hydrolase|nr:hypothetical protein [Candidatus Binatia bacterium]
MRTVVLALALLLAALSPATAQDACLTGASTLGDQRALADLREATEAACPCGAATSRGIWQKCARNVLLGTVLRPECVKTAKTVNKGAACGSTKVACGRVASSNDAPSCKLTRDTRCKDTSKLDATACTDIDFCADAVTWSAGTCDDIRDQGAFAPGFRQIVYTKDSVASPGNPRALDTAIWYPAAPGSGPITGPGLGVVGAPVDPSGAPYPLVLFSHGSCGYPLQSVFLTPLLASRGYIVAAPPHPGNTLNEFPNCGSPAAQVASFQERPQDIVYVLDQLLAANADPGSPFFGMIDPTRIAMAGHSFGGLTVYLVQQIEPRVKVAIPMAPAAQPGFTLTVPSLTILGNIDTVVNNPNARTAYLNHVAPKYLVEIEHAGHYAFSNLCFAGPDCNPPTTLDQDEAHDQVLRYVVPFLERHLNGDERYAAFFAEPPPPGVVEQQVQP